MEPNRSASQENLSELCQRANSNEDFETLFQILERIQRRLEARGDDNGLTSKVDAG
jgi:hypothetical protein